jgi:GNAT superfamily N-acetyltransferase
MSKALFSPADELELVGRKLEDPLLLPAFDCANDAQNQFLHESAWHDQQEWLSTTYLYYRRGVLVAYATVSASALTLGTRERPPSIRYKSTAALKVLRLGVDRHAQGGGIGTDVLADMIAFARACSRHFGCRYLTLDAEPNLVRWYQERGFEVNRAEQNQRIAAASAGKRDPEALAVSMRFDLRDS